MTMYQYAEVKAFLEGRLFNITEDPQTLTVPSRVKEFIGLSYLPRMRLWSLWTFIICPDTLTEPGRLELMAVLLKNLQVIPVYREETLNVHKVLEDLFYEFKNNKMKLSKHKQFLKDAQEPEKMVETHQQLRTYLKCEMATLLSMFSAHPGLLAPKIQMVLCATRLCTEEIEWYFAHMGVPAHNKKKYDPASLLDLNISNLIFLLDELSNLVVLHSSTIAEYHLKYLKGADLRKIGEVSNAFLQANGQVGPDIKDLIANINKCLASCALDSDFEAIRLNWCRTSCALNTVTGGVSPGNAAALNQAMNIVVVHTRCVDLIPQLLVENASLHMLWWRKEMLEEALLKALGSAKGQPRHCLAMVRVLHQALHNVHRMDPEQGPIIGKAASKLCDQFLRTITSHVEKYVKHIVEKLHAMRKLSEPLSGLDKLTKADFLAPGLESEHKQQKQLFALRAWKKALAEIASACHNCETIIVYDREFIPREYLWERVQLTLLTSVRALMYPGGRLQRPTVVLEYIRDLYIALQGINNHCNIQFSLIFRDIMLTEFTDITVGNVLSLQPNKVVVAKQPGDKTKSETSGSTLIHAVADWYGTFLKRCCTSRRGMWSQARKGFTSINGSEEEGFAAEYYADMLELQALCELIGGAGVRLLDLEVGVSYLCGVCLLRIALSFS